MLKLVTPVRLVFEILPLKVITSNKTPSSSPSSKCFWFIAFTCFVALWPLTQVAFFSNSHDDVTRPYGRGEVTRQQLYRKMLDFIQVRVSREDTNEYRNITSYEEFDRIFPMISDPNSTAETARPAPAPAGYNPFNRRKKVKVRRAQPDALGALSHLAPRLHEDKNVLVLSEVCVHPELVNSPTPLFVRRFTVAPFCPDAIRSVMVAKLTYGDQRGVVPLRLTNEIQRRTEIKIEAACGGFVDEDAVVEDRKGEATVILQAGREGANIAHVIFRFLGITQALRGQLREGNITNATLVLLGDSQAYEQLAALFGFSRIVRGSQLAGPTCFGNVMVGWSPVYMVPATPHHLRIHKRAVRLARVLVNERLSNIPALVTKRVHKTLADVTTVHSGFDAAISMIEVERPFNKRGKRMHERVVLIIQRKSSRILFGLEQLARRVLQFESFLPVIVSMEDMTILQQATLVNHPRVNVIIAAHGAALAWIIAARPTTYIMELRPYRLQLDIFFYLANSALGPGHYVSVPLGKYEEGSIKVTNTTNNSTSSTPPPSKKTNFRVGNSRRKLSRTDLTGNYAVADDISHFIVSSLSALV